MKNKTPLIIITYQYKLMTNVIGKVFPSTHHALCYWRICNKYSEKLHQVYATHPNYKSDFNKCVHKLLTIYEFEDWWKSLTDTNKLYKHEWLQGLYAVNEKWIMTYSKRFLLLVWTPLPGAKAWIVLFCYFFMTMLITLTLFLWVLFWG